MFEEIQSPQEMNCAVSFFDLTSFARYVRKCSSHELFELLSHYSEFVGDVIEGAGGCVIKFIGDAGLVAFSEEGVDRGVVGLCKLKQDGDEWLAGRGMPCKHIIKVHFGPVICGPVGTRSEKKLDIFGQTVNVAATLSSKGFSMTPQVFRKLSKDTRKLFKKHTPPVTYIPLSESH